MSEISKSKIFILPTREGLLFLLIGVVLFIIALVYTHNLAFSAAAVFMSVILISAFFTNHNLSKMEMRSVRSFGGESGKAELKVAIFNGSRQQRFGLECSLGGFFSLPINLESGEGGTSTIALKGSRGRYHYKRMTLSTRFPFGLFRAWRNYRVRGTIYIYPSFKGNLLLPGCSGEGVKGEEMSQVEIDNGSEEFFGHKRHQEEDSLYRLDWKAYARERGLWGKVFTDPASPRFFFDYEKVPIKEGEEKLSQLAEWIKQAESMGALYKIRLEGIELPEEWGCGDKYFRDCMEALSGWKNEEKVLR